MFFDVLFGNRSNNIIYEWANETNSFFLAGHGIVYWNMNHHSPNQKMNIKNLYNNATENYLDQSFNFWNTP